MPPTDTRASLKWSSFYTFPSLDARDHLRHVGKGGPLAQVSLPPAGSEGTLQQEHSLLARLHYLPPVCLLVVQAALRQRRRRLPKSERQLCVVGLELLASLRAQVSTLVAAALSSGVSVPALGERAGLLRKQVQAAYGDKVMWHLIDVQQLAAVERTFLELGEVPRDSEGVDDDPYKLSSGQAALATALLTKNSGCTESLIVFLAHRAAQLRWYVAQLPDHRQDACALAAIVPEVYAPLANLMGLGKIKDELEDGYLALHYPELRLELQRQLEEYSGPLLEVASRELRGVLEQELHGSSGSGRLQQVTSLRISGRAKSAYSTWRKMQKKGLELQEVHDRVALRVVLEAPDEEQAVRACYVVKELVGQLWESIDEREKDYIAKPKSNGYRSLHMTVQRDQQVLEVQVRTEAMHRESEYGSAGHWEYKVDVTKEEGGKSDAGGVVTSQKAAGEELFAHLDADGSGHLDASELREALVRFGSAATLEEAQLMLDVFDADRDGEVGFADFWRALATTWFPLISGTHKPRKG